MIGDTRGVWSASQKVSRRVRGHRHDLAQLERARHVVPALGLDDDDLRIRNGQRDSRRKPAAAARDHDPRRRPAELLDDLEPGRALPGDDRRIVEARHHRRAGLVGDPRGDRLAALGAPVVEDDLRALAARAVDLHLRRIGRHDDDRPNAEPPRRDRHAARVIARRKGDDAALALLRRKLQQPVGRAAQLERAAGLQALAFQPDARAADFALDQRRSLDEPGDPLAPLRATSSRVTIGGLRLSY